MNSMLSIIAASRRRETIASRYRAAVMADSPVAYWRLGEESGTTAVDETGSHNGTYLNTPALNRPGIFATNAAASFDAASFEAVEISDRAAFDITGALTIESWVNASSYNNNRGILAKYIGAGDQRSYVLAINASGNPLAVITSSGTFASAKQITSSAIIGTSTWRHVVFVYVPSTSMELFLDGSSILRDTTSIPASIHSGTAPLWVGRQFSDDFVNNHWDGLLDEVAIYPTALSAARIAAHYAAAGY